jgi:hypothetical protein
MDIAVTELAGQRRTPAPASVTLDPDRARGLARWNAALAALHFAQFLLMLAISRTEAAFTASVTYVVPRLENGRFAGLDTRASDIVNIPLAYVVASFFLMSALAHFLLRWPLRARYEAWLRRGMNPARWVEYAFSSTVMILAIAQLSFIKEFSALVAIAGCNVAMNLFGWSMEAANEGRARTDWKHFVFGCVAGIIPWIAIGASLVAYAVQPDAVPIPAFVWAIYGSLFVSFNVFAITMVLQYAKVGRWRDYLTGEKTYMVMSLVAKSLLAWQVWSGTLRPM